MMKTFDKFDKFKRQKLAIHLADAISKFWILEDSAYVLSLNASFGSGKTTFLEMWQNHLRAEGNTVLTINAWKSDFDEEPIIPIVAAFLKDADLPEKLVVLLKEAIGTVLLEAGRYTGVNFKKIFSMLGYVICHQDSRVKKLGDELYAGHAYKHDAYERLKKALEDYVAGLNNKPLYIFIDELDRVRPSYAVEFLEAIKHIFSVKGVCFVIAVDRGQLEQSVKQLYGEIDFDNYYRRFITREVVLPPPGDPNDYEKFVAALGDKYLPFVKSLNTEEQKMILINLVAKLSRKGEFSLRGIEDFFRVVVHYFVAEKTETNEAITATILLIFLSIENEGLYKRIGNEDLPTKSDFEDLSAYIVSFSKFFEQNETNDLRKTALAYSISEKSDLGHLSYLKNRVENIRKIEKTKLGIDHNYELSLYSIIKKRFEKWRGLIE